MHWLQNLDASLFRFINQSLSNPLFDAVMPWFSGNRLFIPLALLGAVFFIWRGRVRAFVCVLTTVAAIALTDGLVCNTIKKAVGRPRPFVTLTDVRLGPETDGANGMADGGIMTASRGGRKSMPSAHAANWFAAGMVLFLYHRRSARFTLPVAITVCFSRVYNGVHYPGDVLAGAILGAGCAAACVFTLNATWRWAGRKWFSLWHEAMPLLVGGGSLPTANPQSHDANRESQIEHHWFRAGCLLIAVLTLARWVYLAGGVIELSEDEAYQWLWSKHLALSYYSKPPFIAYAQFLGTSLWGDNAFGVRFFSPLIAATLGFLMLRFFAREVGARAGFLLVVIVSTTPLLAVGATLMTVDPLSVLFWTAAMLAGWRAIQENSRTQDWFWVGLWMGFGFLSKYTELFQWLCWAVFFALWPPARKQLRRPGPYLALLVNVVCALPVIIWNKQNGWPTIAHVAGNADLGKPWKPTLKYLLDFVGAEFGLLNPVFFVGLVIAAVAFWRRYRNDLRLVYFFSMGAPLFLVYLGWTFHSRVQPNWIAPSVLPLLCVMVIYWDARWRDGLRRVKPWLIAGLGSGLVMVVFMHDTNLVEKVAGRPLPPKLDPLKRVRAWKDVAEAVGQARTKLLAKGKPVFIIGNHYGITSQIAFNLPEAKALVTSDPMVHYQSSDKPRNQFYFWPGYTNRQGQNAIYVAETREREPAPARLTREFESVTDLGLQDVLYRGRVYHTLQIFECRNLR